MRLDTKMLKLTQEQKEELKFEVNKLKPKFEVQIANTLRESFISNDGIRLSEKFLFCHRFLLLADNNTKSERKTKQYIDTLIFTNELSKLTFQYQNMHPAGRIEIKRNISIVIEENYDEIMALINFFIDDMGILDDDSFTAFNFDDEEDVKKEVEEDDGSDETID